MLDSGEASDLLNKIDDELEYVGEDEEHKQLGGDESSSSDEELKDSSDEQDSDSEDVKVINKKAVERKEQIEKVQRRSKEVDKQRVAKILNISEMIEDYTYDAQNLQSFEITFKVRMQIFFEILIER